MFGIENLWLFIVSGLLLNMMPGPDSILIAGRSASQGFRAGSLAALGIGTGTLVHIFAAALGLSAILATSATAFTVVKVIGGLYLLYMAFSMLKGASQGDESKPAALNLASYKAIYLQGLVTNLFNPKVAIFFLSFMPQFISPDSENKALAFIVLGLIFNINGMLWCHFIAWLSSSMSRKISASKRLKVWLNRGAAGLFGAFGIRLLTSSNNS